jgi:hypothetical protein
MAQLLQIREMSLYLQCVFHSIRLRLQRLVARESSHFLCLIFYIQINISTFTSLIRMQELPNIF